MEQWERFSEPGKIFRGEGFPCWKNLPVEGFTVDEQIRISDFSVGGKVHDGKPEGGENFPLSLSCLHLLHKLSLISTSGLISFKYTIVSKPFYEQKSSKFFACGGHLLVH